MLKMYQFGSNLFRGSVTLHPDDAIYSCVDAMARKIVNRRKRNLRRIYAAKYRISRASVRFPCRWYTCELDKALHSVNRVARMGRRKLYSVEISEFENEGLKVGSQ